MLWALWLDEDHRAAKVHLEFDILKGIPIQAQVTHANKSETAQLESALAPGKLYCLDAGYGEYRFLDKIIQQPSSFVMRLRDNASYETIEERTLSEADRKVGIEFDRVVWLGSKQKRNNFSKPMRIIQLHYYFDCQSVNPIVDWPQANQTYLRNDMFVLSGMGFPGGTHRTYRRS